MTPAKVIGVGGGEAVKSAERIVLSASRRTDIPAFYMAWFMSRIRRGWFRVVNPFNGRESIVPARPDQVHTIVFWSKNFGPFIAGAFDRILTDMGYHLFFNFTVNTPDALLEPHVPPLDERLEQMRLLAERTGPEAVHWRFDPICHYTRPDGRSMDNLHGLEAIADGARQAGVRRCITSFMDDYAKIRRRIAASGGYRFVDPPKERKLAILLSMASLLEERGIRLQTCCEKTLQALLPAGSAITPASCVPNDLLCELYGPSVSMKSDTGQRRRAGCGCRVSRDIGDYHRHPCFHNCLFCYANPSPPPGKST